MAGGESHQKSPGPATSPGKSPEQSPGRAEPAVGILPAGHWAEQEPQAVDNDADSAHGTVESSTASITSTIMNYRTLLGRRYHSEMGDAKYWGSNDDKANEAQDIIHHLLTLALDGKLHLAPLDKDRVQKAVDVGTGTGIWVVDFADQFPAAEVTGTDISPIQPTWVPPNVKFELEDCTKEWTFAPDSFDYIHMRWLLGSVVDWTELFRQAFRACKPGGWFESFESSSRFESDDGTVTETSALGQWGKIFEQGGKVFGRSFTIVDDGVQRKAMEEVGFVDIQEFNFKVPVGAWPADEKQKEVGRFAHLSIEQDVEGYVLLMAATLGWTRDEILVYIAHLKREVRSGKLHPFYRQKIVWGRKPG